MRNWGLMFHASEIANKSVQSVLCKTVSEMCCYRALRNNHIGVGFLKRSVVFSFLGQVLKLQNISLNPLTEHI